MSVRQAARSALSLTDPAAKVQAVLALWAQAASGALSFDPSVSADVLARAAPSDIPGRPALPQLVHPREVAQRSVHTPEGRAALLHAVVHIEFNAINLALDAVWRFAGMPEQFYRDWLQVAREEAEHFTMLHEHLRHMGWKYGDFVAHDGLWAMCEKTADDIVARMALVPRTLEARGLDATPLIQKRLRAIDAEDAQTTATLLDTILRDEIGHVAIGNHWYRWLCERERLDAVPHYGVLVERYAAPRLKPPFNEAARKQAGFSQAELDYLLGMGV
ncbi:ferritin-like domain-containing protein [Brachymonas denitrificans]|uniref:ferritin-like domain-containing protein n=1 Tax=Brachymonas denitrificans TaxID=28220 RepID=UPI001BD00B61|nr:ferritin-like domain-containing protein [Brachymonas denitrificans]